MCKDVLEKLHVGTSGWSYGDWVGPFYEAGTPASDYLSQYALQFATVEVDATFYAIPTIKTVKGWERRTDDRFRFALKVPGTVTHGAVGARASPEKVLVDDDGHLEKFLECVEPLGRKLGPLVFQFPYFRVREMEPADFLDRLSRTLDRLPRDKRFAVEIRNRKWVDSDYLDLLRTHGAAAVLVDHPYMPLPRQQLDLDMVTTDFAYIRLLGDRYAIERKTKKWNAVVEDKDKRIRSWAEVIHRIVSRAAVTATYVFSNNHFAGHGPATSRQLLDVVESIGDARDQTP